MQITKKGTKAIGAQDTDVTITFSTDEVANVPASFKQGSTVIPGGLITDWATSVRLVSISETEMVVAFGTEPGGYGGTLYWNAMNV